MVADVKFKIRNKDRLHRKLSKLVDGFDQQVEADMKKGAEELAVAVKGYAPVKTGEYRDSIVAKPVTQFDQHSSTGITRVVEARAWGLYANDIWRFLEFGTQKMRSRPHIFGLFRLMRRRIRGRISRGINKKVKAIVGTQKK